MRMQFASTSTILLAGTIGGLLCLSACELDDLFAPNINDTGAFSHPNWGHSYDLSATSRAIVSTASPGAAASVLIGDPAPIKPGAQGRIDNVSFLVPQATSFSTFTHFANMAYYDRATHDRFGTAVFRDELCVEYAVPSCATPPDVLAACTCIPELEHDTWYSVQTIWAPEAYGNTITALLMDSAGAQIARVDWSIEDSTCRPQKWQQAGADVDMAYAFGSYAVGDEVWLRGNATLTGH